MHRAASSSSASVAVPAAGRPPTRAAPAPPASGAVFAPHADAARSNALRPYAAAQTAGSARRRAVATSYAAAP